jgi:hypothetical protein
LPELSLSGHAPILVGMNRGIDACPDHYSNDIF